LEGVLLAGAGNAFDVLAYNAYYGGDKLDGRDWETPYLRGIMQAYKVPPKPMLITETALLCDPGCPKLQAYAVGRFYTRDQLRSARNHGVYLRQRSFPQRRDGGAARS